MMSVSLDGSIEGPQRDLDWHKVDDELHRHFNEQLGAMGCRATTRALGSELVFSGARQAALRYSLIRPLTTWVRSTRAVTSTAWPGSCSEVFLSATDAADARCNCRAYSVRVRQRCRSP